MLKYTMKSISFKYYTKIFIRIFSITERNEPNLRKGKSKFFPYRNIAPYLYFPELYVTITRPEGRVSGFQGHIQINRHFLNYSTIHLE